MKKLAFLTAALVLASSSAYAYENLAGGYAVNDSKANATVNSKKTFGYMNTNDKNADMHIVNYFSAQEVETITGEQFSNEKFLKLYDEMALLKRTDLPLDKAPHDMVDLKKYAEAKLPGSLVLCNTNEDFKDLKPTARIDKIGNYKTITFNYLFKQGDTYLSCDSSFVSANNQLYLLTSFNTSAAALSSSSSEENKDLAQEETKTTNKAAQAGTADSDAEAQINGLKEKLSQKVEPIAASQVAKANLDDLWNKHLAFVKGFKVFTPQEDDTPFGYEDANYGKRIVLPDDWAYTQIKVDKNMGSGILTISAPLGSLRSLANDSMKETLGMKNGQQSEKTEEIINGEFKPGAARYEVIHKFLQNMDAMLMTGSFQVKDKDLTAMLEDPLTLKLEAYGFLKAGLERMKQNPMAYFTLNDYDFDVNTAPGNAVLDINADVTALQDVNLDTRTKLAASNDAVLLLLFGKQRDKDIDELIQQALDAWQF